MSAPEDIQLVLKLFGDSTIPADLAATALHVLDACLKGAEQAELKSIADEIPQISDQSVSRVLASLESKPSHGLQLKSAASDAIMLTGVMGAEAASRLIDDVEHNASSQVFGQDRLAERLRKAMLKRQPMLVEEIIRRLRDALSEDLDSCGVETRVDVGKGSQTGITTIYVVIECLAGDYVTRRQVTSDDPGHQPLRLVDKD